MPIFVGDNADGSRIRSNRVGLAVSTANPGSASEGDVYYNSTDSQIKSYDGSSWNVEGAGSGGTVEAVASGSIADGQAVVLLSNGKVSGITSTSGTLDMSSQNTIYSNYFSVRSAIYHTGQNKVVAVWSNAADNKSYVIVGNPNSGGGISWGSAVALHGDLSSVNHACVTQISSNKVLIAHSRAGGQAAVGTISGTSITVATQEIFNSDATDQISIVYDSGAQRSVIYFRDDGNNDVLGAVVASVSGTTPSFGTKVNVTQNDIENTVAVYHESAGKTVVFARDSNSGNIIAAVGTVDNSDNSISFGETVTLWSYDRSCDNIQAGYSPEDGKIYVFYRALTSGSSNAIHGQVGTINGTSISFGKPCVAPKPISGLFGGGSRCGTQLYYDETAKRITFLGDTNANRQTIFTARIDGDQIIYDDVSDLLIFNRYTSNAMICVYNEDYDTNHVIYESSQTNPPQGKYNSVDIPFKNTTLTSENFLGFSNGAYTNGQTATIQIAGSIDDAQSGLTPGKRYFVQGDGTLRETRDNPVVTAGTALSSTEILIRK